MEFVTAKGIATRHRRAGRRGSVRLVLWNPLGADLPRREDGLARPGTRCGPSPAALGRNADDIDPRVRRSRNRYLTFGPPIAMAAGTAFRERHEEGLMGERA